MEQEPRLAILIDADNAPRTALREIMAEVAVYGTPTIKRIYGDWTSPSMGSWKPLLLEHAITPFQQYSYTTGKNATDSAMISRRAVRGALSASMRMARRGSCSIKTSCCAVCAAGGRRGWKGGSGQPSLKTKWQKRSISYQSSVSKQTNLSRSSVAPG